MDSKKKLSKIMSVLLAASSMIGGASADSKKKSKKPNGPGVVLNNKNGRGRNKRKGPMVEEVASPAGGTPEYGFYKDPRNYGEMISGLSALGLGGAAIYYGQKVNLHQRFMKELGSFYSKFFSCKSANELCNCLYAGKDKSNEGWNLKIWYVDSDVAKEPCKLEVEKCCEDSDFALCDIGKFFAFDNEKKEFDPDLRMVRNGFARIGLTWVDIRKGDYLVDIAVRFAFYDTFLKSCLSDGLVKEKNEGDLSKNFDVSSFENEEIKSGIPMTADCLATDGYGRKLPVLLLHARHFVNGENTVELNMNIKKIEDRFNLCKKFASELRNHIGELESQAKK